MDLGGRKIIKNTNENVERKLEVIKEYEEQLNAKNDEWEKVKEFEGKLNVKRDGITRMMEG